MAKTPLGYYVWRKDARQPFRTYRLRKSRPLPDDGECIWSGSSFREGMRVQKSINSLSHVGRKTDHPGQRVIPGLYPESA